MVINTLHNMSFTISVLNRKLLLQIMNDLLIIRVHTRQDGSYAHSRLECLYNTLSLRNCQRSVTNICRGSLISSWVSVHFLLSFTFIYTLQHFRSVGGIASRLRNGKVGLSNPNFGRLLRNVQTGSEDQPAQYSIGIGDLYWRGERDPCVMLTTHSHLEPRIKMGGVIPLLLLHPMTVTTLPSRTVYF